MKIETYKGIDIYHDPSKDIFFTKLVLNKRTTKKDEIMSEPRLQKMRDTIDKWLNVQPKKPLAKRAYLFPKNSDNYNNIVEVDIISYNHISGQAVINENGYQKEHSISTHLYSRDSKLFIKCKENTEIVKELQKATAQISEINKRISCTRGKLIPLTREHFSNESNKV